MWELVEMVNLLWTGPGDYLKYNLYLAKLMSPDYPTPLTQSCQKMRNYLLHLVTGHGFKNLRFILNLNVSAISAFIAPVACYGTDELTKVSPFLLSTLFLNCVPNSGTSFISATLWDEVTSSSLPYFRSRNYLCPFAAVI